MILLLCRFQNHASHRGRGAYFQKIGWYFVKKGARSMEGTKKTADRIRNWQNCCIDAYTHFCWRGSGGEKCTGLQPEAIFWCGHGTKKWRSERPKERKEQIKSQKMLLLRPFGGQKMKFLIKIVWSRFAKVLSPLEQEQQFWKNVMQKVSWNMKSIKEAVWSLHFWCIFVSWSGENEFFAFGPASAERNENH